MAFIDRREVFARHSRQLALLLEVLVVLALLSGAFPFFALANPVWYLRLSDSAVGLAPVLLLAVILLRLARVLLANDSELGLSCGKRSFDLAKRWAIVFAVIVPLQLLCSGWLWVDSERQLDARISQVETQRTTLLDPLRASGSQAELQRLVAQAPPGSLPPLKAGSLSDQKQQLSQAVNGSLAMLTSNLRKERTAMLCNSFPGSLRVLIGAAITSAFLFTLTRQI